MRWNSIGRVAAAAALIAGFAAVAAAQPPRGGGMGMPRYDKSTETTVVGTVSEVLAHQGRMGGTGLHLTLATADGAFDVHVGPTRWLADRQLSFAAGDQIEVVGSRITFDGKPAILAREIRRGGVATLLRNDAGIPLWSRGAARP